jgi:putative phosphoribosyl transferase
MARSSRVRPPPIERRLCEAREVRIAPLGLVGTLRVPQGGGPLVVFVHGGVGSEARLRHTIVADALNQHGFSTLRVDPLGPNQTLDPGDPAGVPRLAELTIAVVRWLQRESPTEAAVGLFGADAGSAAALVAAAKLGDAVGAVVACDGAPGLAGQMLDHVRAPALLIVGGNDPARDPDREAFARLHGPKALEVIPEARHLFDEPAARDMVIVHATRWFVHYLRRSRSRASRR